MEPAISTVLPVYNCPQYVGEAIESILAQTFADFELIIIDDGSTDETPQILRRFSDPRIRLVSQENQGLAATLNRGIALARGRYVARQDQDDVSLHARFERQVEYLDANPTCALVGTWAQIWREGKPTQRVHSHPHGNARLKFELLLNNPFVHSSVMIRKAALDHVGGYSTDRNRQPPEDYELWSRIARAFDVANIPEILHVYREVDTSMSRDGPSPFLDHLVTICAENIAVAAKVRPDDPPVVNIAALAHGAAHRLRGEPDWGEMGRLFLAAARNVTSEEGGDEFESEAADRIEALRYRLLDMRSRAPWRRTLVRALLKARRAVLGA